MKQLVSKLLRIATLLASHVPSRLPENDVEHAAWAGSVLSIAGYPDNDSLRCALATMILHLDASRTRASKQSFIKQIKRSIANQAAYNAMSEFKAREKAARGQQLSETSKAVVQEA